MKSATATVQMGMVSAAPFGHGDEIEVIAAGAPLEDLIVTCLQCAETVGGPMALLALKCAKTLGIDEEIEESAVEYLDDEAPEEAAEIRKLQGMEPADGDIDDDNEEEEPEEEDADGVTGVDSFDRGGR